MALHINLKCSCTIPLHGHLMTLHASIYVLARYHDTVLHGNCIAMNTYILCSWHGTLTLIKVACQPLPKEGLVVFNPLVPGRTLKYVFLF